MTVVEIGLGKTLQIQTPRKLAPMLESHRYKGLYGGRGGMKSHFFAELLIETCMLREIRAVCIREIMQSLKESVKRLLEDKIEYFGVNDQFNVLNTHIEAPHGGIIIFMGMQNHTAQSIKSLEGYDIAWVEEAQSLSDHSLTLLRPTIRKENSEIWFSWNPDQPTDPVDKMLRHDKPPDTLVIQTGWQDNPWFPDVLQKEMEWDRQIDPEKYAHVWGGQYVRNSESRVFKNWRIEAFDTPANSVFYLGGDWGFSVDPTVAVRCFEQRPAGQRKQLYIDYEVYQIGCEIDDIPHLFDQLGCRVPITAGMREQIRVRDANLLAQLAHEGYGSARHWPLRADSARPETISYLRRHGYSRITAATKGPNSVKEGVIFLQGYDVIIHPRCQHTIDEFTMYSYVVDRLTGIVTPFLEDKKNHVIDSVRYAVEPLRGIGLQQREAVWG